MSFDGPTAPGYIVRRLRSGEGTGVILFARNAPDAGTLRALTASLQRAAGGTALVATDQEGGDIRTLPFGPPQESQGRLGSPEAVTAAARDAARGLRAGGVNVNLAPVGDVADSLGSVVAGRAFPGGGREVAELTAASTRAHGRERVGATAKHFPGLGRATENTDDTSVTIPAPRAELEGTDLLPFTAAIRAGTPLVMSSHALYPALDRRRIASQSPAILKDLLRGTAGLPRRGGHRQHRGAGRAGPLGRGGGRRALARGRQRPDPDDRLGLVQPGAAAAAGPRPARPALPRPGDRGRRAGA